MLKFKTFLVVTIIVVFSFSLIGCGLLTSRSAEPVEEVSEGELPEWLLLAYRADNSDVAEKNEAAGELKEPPAETTQSAETTQPATAATQPASGGTAPATTAPSALTSEEKFFQDGDDAFDAYMLKLMKESFIASGGTEKEWEEHLKKKEKELDGEPEEEERKMGSTPDWVSN